MPLAQHEVVRARLMVIALEIRDLDLNVVPCLGAALHWLPERGLLTQLGQKLVDVRFAKLDRRAIDAEAPQPA